MRVKIGVSYCVGLVNFAKLMLDDFHRCCPDLDPVAACLLGVALLSKLSLVGGRVDMCGGLDCCSVVCVYLNMRGSMLARDIDGFWSAIWNAGWRGQLILCLLMGISG